jgi:segregation and condensation protein B
MPVKIDPLVLRVEALLFASGKPLTVAEIGSALGIEDYRPVQAAVRQLSETYDGRQTALEVRRVGDAYALKLREEFVATAQPMTPLEIPERTLRTLTLIAYHQPVRQSVVARMVGDSAYEEVQRLRELGFINASPRGATLELRTTRQFSEYFGMASTRPEDIRRVLEQKLGVLPTAPMGASGIGMPALPEEETPPEPTAEALATIPPAVGSNRPAGPQNAPQ